VDFRFQEQGHVYTLDGSQIDSVTDILGSVGFLPSFEFVDDFYRERGSAIHKAIELDIMGVLDEETVDPVVLPYLERARRFIDHYVAEVLLCERPMYCPTYLYAGTPDLLFRSHHEGLVLPDWKAGDLYPAYEVQVAGGYLPMIEQNATELDLDPAEIATADLWLVPLGREVDLPEPVAITPSYHRELFRAAVAVHNWRKQHG